MLDTQNLSTVSFFITKYYNNHSNSKVFFNNLFIKFKTKLAKKHKRKLSTKVKYLRTFNLL